MNGRDKTPKDTLGRLVRSCSGKKLPKNYRIEERIYTIEYLAGLQVEAHEVARPYFDNLPVLLYKSDGHHILDGQNRINLWKSGGRIKQVRCLEVVPG